MNYLITNLSKYRTIEVADIYALYMLSVATFLIGWAFGWIMGRISGHKYCIRTIHEHIMLLNEDKEEDLRDGITISYTK